MKKPPYYQAFQLGAEGGTTYARQDTLPWKSCGYTADYSERLVRKLYEAFPADYAVLRQPPTRYEQYSVAMPDGMKSLGEVGLSPTISQSVYTVSQGMSMLESVK